MIRRGVEASDSLIENQVVTAATPTAGTARRGRPGRGGRRDACSAPPPTRGSTSCERADGEPALLELELLDPMLFFVHHHEGAATFAAVLAGLVSHV